MSRYSIDEPTVLMPARVAFALWRKLDLDNFRGTVPGHDFEMHGVLQAWQGMAHDYQRREMASRKEICGSLHPPPPEVAASSEPSSHLTTSQVAGLADVTTRAVRLAADEHRLKGTKDDNDAWQFDQADVTEWLATRTR